MMLTPCLPIRVQAWCPLSSRHADSQDLKSDDDDDGGQAVAERTTAPETDGQPLFSDTLDMLMNALESELPPVPVQGPESPQVPSPPRADKALAEASKPAVVSPAVREVKTSDGPPKVLPLPTPCRADPTGGSHSISTANGVGASTSSQARSHHMWWHLYNHHICWF